MLDMTAGHVVFIPAVLLLGMVIGWILGSRAAADAYAAELRRREERAPRTAGDGDRARRPGVPRPAGSTARYRAAARVPPAASRR